MRALFDATLVGAGTVRCDDPRLTVRACVGDNPLRVVIDAERRLHDHYRVFCDGSAPTLLLCAEDRRAGATRHGKAAILGLPRTQAEEAEEVGGAGVLSPRAIRKTLSARGCRRLYIEGGGITISRFLRAGCLDRLQVTVAPLILGSGRPAITLPEIDSLAEGLRPRMRRFALGDDMMFECVFHE